MKTDEFCFGLTKVFFKAGKVCGEGGREGRTEEGKEGGREGGDERRREGGREGMKEGGRG